MSRKSWWPSSGPSGPVPGLLALGLLALCLWGCSGDPPPVAPPPAATQVPLDPGLLRYVPEGGRLVFPTATPAPTPTPRPVLDVRTVLASRTPEPTPTEAVFVREPLQTWGSLEADPVSLSCRDRYREMLIAYSGRVPLGPEVAGQLSDELLRNRPECGLEGWAPEFSLERVCVRSTVGGIRLSPALVHSGGPWDAAQAVGSRRDRSGNILLHFGRMPLEESRGCWYYQASGRLWSWFVSGRGGGVDVRIFPRCDGLLRAMVLDRLSPDTGVLEVARAIDRVRAQEPEGCPEGLWDPYPASAPQGGCGLEAPTGLTPRGALVINWQPGHLASGDAVCWVWNPGGAGWSEHYSQEVEGDASVRSG